MKFNGMLDQLREGLRRCGISGARMVVGVSGGADSVALLRGLVDVSPELKLDLHVAHFNHKLRGKDSDEDAKFVSNLAESLRLPCEIGFPKSDELSAITGAMEETARNLRYQFLDEVAARCHCSAITVAHTADDQVETVLHHFLRGTGISGLRGIPMTRDTKSGLRLVRPLLLVPREQVLAYLRDQGQIFQRDSTNDDTSLTRNRLRHVVLPLLRQQMNPQVDIAIRRLSDQAAEIEEILAMATRKLADQTLMDQQPDSCCLNVTNLVSEPRHLVRELFREVWFRQTWPVQSMGYEQWDRLAEILTTRETITLPNRIETRFHSGNLLVLRRLS